MSIKEKIGKEIIIFDGAMGTMLQKSGLKLGELPEELNIEEPEIIQNIHRSYIEAGVNVLTTNTFGANEKKMIDSKYTVEEIVQAAVENAKKSIEHGEQYIALGVGSIGQLLEPMGTLSFEDAYNIYKRQIIAGVNSGVDLILFETMTDLYELKAAILAAKENSNLPILSTMSFEKDGRTFTGCSPLSMIMVLEGLGVDALGINCSLGPKEIEPILNLIIENSTIPVMVQPNAGLPEFIDGETVYNFSKYDFAKYGRKFIEKGVSIIGGCCGTTDEYMSLLVEEIKDMKISKVKRNKLIGLCTPSRPVILDQIRSVGERINPTGKDEFKKEYLSNEFNLAIKEAIEQNESGADILDINVGLPEIDEVKIMVNLIKNIQEVTDIPLQIDSNNPKVIESALRVYNGKAIINSTTGEEKSMNSIFPLAKKYGAMVIGLTLDERGIPKTAEERFKIAEKIISTAENFDIDRSNIIIDTLTLTAATEQDQAMETLKAITMIKEKLNVKTTLGISNISFGFPNRELINRNFLNSALYAGLDLPIIDPLDKEIMNTIKASKLILGQDENGGEYIDYYNDYKDIPIDNAQSNKDYDLVNIIQQGNINLVEEALVPMLDRHDPMFIVDEFIIPSLDKVGERFENQEIFLPQLVQSAETVKKAFEILNSQFEEGLGEKKGKIILATVEGDVHDIGKNIVKVLLENYNYQIIDMGRDVPKEDIVQMAIEEDVKLIGLSALMTTTVKSMKETILDIKKIDEDIKIMVGGAVLTEDYAKKIGADFYAKDAKESVTIANEYYNLI